jgi:hypothetical protein
VGLGRRAAETSPDELEPGSAVLARLLVASGRDPAFHRADPRLEIELGGERLRRKLRLRQVRQEAARVEEDRMAAERFDDRDSQALQALAHVMHLADPRPDMILRNGLFDAEGHRLHVASRESPVRVEPFVDDDEIARLLEHLRVVQREETSDVDQEVLLGAHRAAVGQGAHLLQDRSDRPLPHPRFPLLDEPRIFDRSRRVEDDADPEALAERADGAQVRHRDRLPPGHVDRRRHGNVRNPRRPDAFDEGSSPMSTSLEGWAHRNAPVDMTSTKVAPASSW